MTIDRHCTMLAHKLLTGDNSCFVEAAFAEWIQAVADDHKDDVIFKEATVLLISRLVRIFNLEEERNLPTDRIFENENGGDGDE